MVDPTYSGQLDIPKPTKGKGSKGKKGAKEATGYVVVLTDMLFLNGSSSCYQSRCQP